MNFEYIEFINSEQWNLLRSLRRAIDKETCQCCGDKINLEVHHKYNGGPNYTHIVPLGNEDPITCLLTLCQPCHKAITESVRKRREACKIVRRKSR